jgi:membrane protease YdiL (CAAX protease family)
VVEVALRFGGPWVLALLTGAGVVAWSQQRGVQAPALVPEGSLAWRERRVVVAALLAVVFYFTVYQSLGVLGLAIEVDLDALPSWRLFLLHFEMLAGIALWYLVGFAGARQLGAGDLRVQWWCQLGLASARPGRELALGLVAGVLGWAGVLAILLVLALMVVAFGGSSWLPSQPPELVVWIATLAWPIRLAAALSAGFVEELFFRGFLQPRIGIGASTAMFAVAHLGYGQPFFLLGVVLLSLGFAALARARRNIWPAIAAHFVFDAIQLMILIPLATGTRDGAPNASVLGVSVLGVSGLSL